MSAAAGLVLTGGAARRLGADKATLERGGERLVDRVWRALAEVADPVLEVGPGRSRRPWVREDPPGAGPLAAFGAGLVALAERGAADRPVLLVAVDLPGITPALLAWLRDHPAPGAVVPVVDGRRQPLCARYPVGVAALVAEARTGGGTSMRALLDRLTVTEVGEDAWSPVASSDAFADLDEPADLVRSGWEVPRSEPDAPSGRR